MVTSGDLWSYLNGNIVKGKDAAVPIFDRGLQWGDAVYDTIRTYDGSPFRLDFRTDRFYDLAKKLIQSEFFQIPVPKTF